MNDLVPFECVDGLLFVPGRYVESLAEVRAEGGLTVSLAHRKVSEWKNKEGNASRLTRTS